MAFRWRTSESNDEIPYTHHGYAYALSNPVLLTDPSGRCAEPGRGDDYCHEGHEGDSQPSVEIAPHKADWWNRDRPCIDHVEITLVDSDGHTHCYPFVSP